MKPLHVRSILNFVKSHHIDFHSGYKSLHSHQEWGNVPIAQHPCQHELLFVLLSLVILRSVSWILNHISLMSKDLYISLHISQTFETHLLRIICLYLYSTYSLECFVC